MYKVEGLEQIPLDNRSLTVAFANMLERFEVAGRLAPLELHSLLTKDDPSVDFWSIAEYIENVEIGDVKNFDGCGWPITSNAIVKFRRMDEEAAGPIDHYCLVADHHQRSIIDSLDGVIKSANTYGEVLGWASYMEVEPDEELKAMEQAAFAAAAAQPKNSYILQEGENVWDVGRRFNVKVADLLIYNQFNDDPRLIKAGYVLRIPVADAEGKQMVTYEVFDKPVQMHVIKPGGTTKFSFGNARSWTDIKPTARQFPERTNVLVVAVAHIELELEGVTAAYYMTATDLGNYATNGRVAYTTGFNHSHLAEGWVDPLVVQKSEPPKIEEVGEPIQIEREAVVEKKPQRINAVYTAPEGGFNIYAPPKPEWQNTFTPLNMQAEPETFIAREDIMVRELEGKRSAKQLLKSRGVKITGTFEKDGKTYYRPDAGNLWYGIPTEYLMSEAELYNINMPLAERAVMRNGQLTFIERYWSVPFAKLVSQGARLRAWFKTKKRT